jgi:3-keto-5-aminohexanoate cleavage enzyme
LHPVTSWNGRVEISWPAPTTDLLPFLAADAPHFLHWSVCAFGRHEAACVSAAALLGGHVRLGFENNLPMPNGDLAPIASALRDLGYDLCDAAKLRGSLYGGSR